MNEITKLIKQGDEEQFKQKTILFHFEFTGVCNQQCSYCLEGNFDPTKAKAEPSKKEDLLSTLDKIFEAYDENVNLGFILVGGEPTKQPYFIDVVEKIKARKNAFQVLTTNFTESVEYFKKLDIPLVTSMHLDSHEPKEWLDKTLQLKDLIMETRIMAHPQKMDKVKEAYELFFNTSKSTPLSFAVEEIFDFEINVNGNPLKYKANYNQDDLEWVRTHEPVRMDLPKSLEEKAGILKNIFYGSQWFYDNNEVKLEERDKTDFKGWFCERNMVIIRSNGDLNYGWSCQDSVHNIYKEAKFPKQDIKTVICNKKNCPINLASTTPKYSCAEYAPDYVNRCDLAKLKILNTIMKKTVVKFFACFLPTQKQRKALRSRWF